jgi:hypothetical protein
MTLQKWVQNLKNEGIKSHIQTQANDYLHSQQQLVLSLMSRWLDLSGL